MNEWKNFVTAKELQAHWKVLPAELLDFIHGGLPVYRQTGILIEPSELLPEKTLLDITKELALRAARDSEARKCRSFITLANIPRTFHRPTTPPTTETLSDIHTEAKPVFEKLRKRKDNQTLTDLNTFLFKHDEINQFAQLRELKTINEAEVLQVDATTTLPPTSVESCTPKMKRWIPGWELRERWVPWNVSHYDIVSMILNGELTAHNTLDQTPIDVDIEKPLREKIEFLRSEIGVMGIALGGKNLESYRKDIKDDLTRLITLGLDGFLFKMAEVEEYEHTHGLILQTPQTEPAGQSDTPNSSTPDRVASIVQTDPEAFMRSLSVAYLSDTEVSIKVGNREPEKCTSREMGFEKKPKLWQPFIKLLQTTDHKYHVGTYSRDKDPVKNQNYNKLVKQLSNFSKLFLSFLNDKFSVSLPMGFNVYQNMKGHEKAGTYKLKFHIVDRHEDTQSTDIKMMTETEIINKIRSLSEQLQKKDNLDKDQLLQEIGHYATHATKMRWITEEQLRNMITPPDADPSRDDAMLLAVSNRENNGF